MMAASFISESIALHTEVGIYKGVTVHTDYIAFRVKSCGIPSLYFRTEQNWVFSVRFGVDNGFITLIRFEVKLTYAHVRHNITQTDCNAFKDYWLKWNSSFIEVGNGLQAGINAFMVASNNDSWVTVTYARIIADAATDWIFFVQVVFL